jgi:transcriptional regulator with XRE-family HTH domain
MKAKQFLQDPALKAGEFARRIGWNKTSMSLWLSGKGNIPLDKLKLLETELRGYGYS